MPRAEVDRADHGLDGVGQDRRLVATAGGLLAATELDVLAEADHAGDLGERAGVDDGGAELGQPALGEVGVEQVERLGDDDAEHGVAEELEALVGRQPAVLVGVRAVRQGAVEQLGVEVRIPERTTQFVVDADGRMPGSAVRDQRTWRRSALAPYWPHVPHARCGRCFAPQAGLAQVTSVGATAFHCERRCRVLLRDIFRFGTATVFSSLVLVVFGELGQHGPAGIYGNLMCVVRIIGEPRPAIGTQSGTVRLAQRLER